MLCACNACMCNGISSAVLQSGGNKDAGGSVLDAAYSSLDSPLLQSFVDKDYLDFETDGLDGGYNYLDTNFIPRS